MASLNLLADLDAERINGGSGGGVWGKPKYRSHPKHGSSHTSISHKSATTNLIQGNVANNLAIGLGFHGFGMANATSEQENVAFITTVAG